MQAEFFVNAFQWHKLHTYTCTVDTYVYNFAVFIYVAICKQPTSQGQNNKIII